jgi:hypothetical protein
MRLATDEFIRRFLIHVLPKGLHRIHHSGLLAKGTRAANLHCSKRPRDRRAAEQRDELAPFHCQMPPVLPTERITHLSYGRRLLRCGISVRPGLGCAKTSFRVR